MSLSTSLLSTLITFENVASSSKSSLTVRLSAVAVGSSFTALIVTLTVAVSDPPLPSLIVQVKVSGPLLKVLTWSFGEYRTSPAMIWVEPSAPCVQLLTKGMSPSMSESLLKTSISTSISSSIVFVSSTASGSSFWGSIVILTVPKSTIKAAIE